jgi:hypothetical protein
MADELNGNGNGNGNGGSREHEATTATMVATAPPTEALVAGTVGDRCVNCGTALSSDQRYCVVCGERRGAPRFSLPAPAAATAETVAETTTTVTRRRGLGGVVGGSGATIVGFVGTLLLALLIGVLIGHNTAGKTTTVTPGQTKVIKVNVGGSSGAAAAPTSTSSAGSGSTSAGAGAGSGSGSHKTHKSSTPKASTTKAPPVTKQQAKALQSAAQKATGGSGGAAPTSTVGSSCAKGSAGCGKNGKFNGSFFGG